MKINGKITLLASEDGVSIEIEDEASSCVIVKGFLTSEQFCQALGRLAHTKMKECAVYNLDIVGKKMELDKLEFPLSSDDYTNNRELAQKEVHKYCPEGWKPDISFSSQNSFFYTKDNKRYARTTIRRWV